VIMATIEPCRWSNFILKNLLCVKTKNRQRCTSTDSPSIPIIRYAIV